MTPTRLRSRAIAGLAFALSIAAPQAAIAAAPEAPPAAAFASLPGVRFVAISPNGKLLAQDEAKPGLLRIIIWDVETTKTQRILNIDTANKLRGVRWADDQTVLVDVSVQKAMPCNASRRCSYEWWRTMAVTLDGSPPRMLLMDDAERKWVTSGEILAARPNRPHSVTMQSWDYLVTREKQTTGSRIGNDRDRSGWTNVVFDVDTRSGNGRPLATGTAYTDQWVVDRAGDPVARSEWRPASEDYSIVARQGSSWREVYRQSKRGELDLGGLTLDGKSIVVIGAIDSDRRKAWSMPLDGSPMTVLYENPNGDVSSAVFDETLNAVVGVRTGGLETSTQWFDSNLRSQARALGSAYAGKRVHIIDRSQSGQRLIILVDSPSVPPSYHFVDMDKSRADRIGDAYPALASAALGAVRFINYPARDGTSIPAYLTLPPGRGEKNLPMIVLPHGGPEARDEGDFDWLAQFLATRGYAVLQPQFRGSTGFGDAFRKAGYRQWGKLMQDDVSDGLRHFVADGTVDPNRVCIVGWSYGGYSALAGGAFTPDLYACIASIAGVSDLPTMLQDAARTHGKESDTIEYWTDHIGPPSNPEVAARSPSHFAANFRVPVLLLHGIDDSVVPIAQSERMARALEKAGKPVTFVKLPGEDHYLSRAETRLQVLQELEKYLAQYLH